MALNDKVCMNQMVMVMTVAAVSASITGCAGPTQQQASIRSEMVYAVTASNRLVYFNAGRPDSILSQRPLVGLQAGETLLGIDYRVAKGWLYGLGSSGRLYRINTVTGVLTMIGNGPVPMLPSGSEVGFDFNPTVDRIRVVGDQGINMRLHPDTGAVVDGDPDTPGLQRDRHLTFAADDIYAGRRPSAVAAAYTYNKQDEKLTTNFAIDTAHGVLVTQGSVEGLVPAVSPNSGRLYTVGTLGIGPVEKVSFDIADLSGSAFIAANRPGAATTTWYQINLATGKAAQIGVIGTGERVTGIAVEP